MSVDFIGGKAGGGSFKQRPDNLRSDDTLEVLAGLCTGPIKGPTRGLKSITLDGTPIEDDAGTLNFPGWVATVADGDPSKWPQKVPMRLGAGAAPQSVGVQFVGAGAWVSRTLSAPSADAIDLRFIVSQLFYQDKKGVRENSATLEIELKPSGATQWINPLLSNPSGGYPPNGKVLADYGDVYIPRSFYNAAGTAWETDPNAGYLTITGKTTSPYVKELRIAVPNDGAYANKTWDVRVRLIQADTVDADPIQERRIISWESLSAVFTDVIGEEEDWRGVAWLQIHGVGSDQLTGVPLLEAEFDTKIVSVPPASVFNPETRAYTGATWDGAWAKAYTNDPAWVINDAISDSLSGLAALAIGSELNKWDALEASKYFSELVPDGAGGWHPRYSLNVVNDQPQSASEYIRLLAGAVGALAWEENDGIWRMKVDKAENPSAVFTEENIEGEFVYSHSDVDVRYNDITGVFLNAEFDYREDRVQAVDAADIAARGRKPTTIALIGCTNRQEALRRVVLRLRTSLNEKRVVTFTTNRQGELVQWLDTIHIADGSLADAGERSTGRIIGRRVNLITNGEGVGGTGTTPATNWLVEQPYGGLTPSGWTSGYHPSGRGYAQFTVSGTTTVSNRLLVTPAFNPRVAVTAGQLFSFAWDGSVVSGSHNVQVNLMWYNASNALVSTTMAPPRTLTTTEQRFVETATPPAGAVTCKVRFDFIGYNGTIGTAVNQTFRLGGMQFESGSAGGYIPTTNGTREGIDLRDPVRIEAATSYKVQVTVPNAAYDPDRTTQPTNPDWKKPTVVVERDVLLPTVGDIKTLALSAPLPSDTPTNAPVALKATGLPSNPVAYRVIKVSPADDGERCTVTAIEIDTGKWAAADNATEAAYQNTMISAVVPPPGVPAGGMFTVRTFLGEAVQRNNLQVSWERPASLYLTGFRVRYRINSGPWVTLAEKTRDTSVELADIAPGFYDFEIISIDRRGNYSLALIGTYEVFATAGAYPVFGQLTNESHVVATNADGTGGDFSSAGGTFEVYLGVTKITSGVTFTVTSEAGVDVSINGSGVYSVTSMSADTGTATFRAVYGNYTLERTFTIAKSKAGINGPALQVTFDKQNFTFVDNVGSPSGQVIALTANQTNIVGGTVTWSTSPGVTLYNAASGGAATTTGSTVYLRIADFGSNRQVKVTATHSSGVADTVSVNRLDNSTAAAGATVGAPVGTYVATVPAADVAAGVTNFNSRNDRLSTTPVSPTALAITAQLNTDGSANLTLGWTYSGPEADIDGFIIYLHDAASGAAFTITQASGKRYDEANPKERQISVPGVPADRFYTWGVQAFRVVDPDVAASGILFSSISQSGPTQPTSIPNYGGNVGGVPASQLSTAKSAVDALTADGVISRAEKHSLKVAWAKVGEEYFQIDQRAQALGISTTAMLNAYSALHTKIQAAALTNGQDYVMQSWTRAEWDADWDTMATAMEAVRKAISEKDATTGIWSSISGAGKPSDNAGTAVRIIDYNSMPLIQGNSVIKEAAGGYTWGTGAAYVLEEYRAGCVVGCRAVANNTPSVFGLSDAVSTIDSTDIDYGFLCASDGFLYIYENGVQIGGAVSDYSTNTWLSIHYENTRVIYRVNGIQVRVVATTNERTFRFKCSVYAPGDGFKDIQVKSGLSLLFDDQGGANKPENKATYDIGADTRTSNFAPSYYQTNYPMRTVREFKELNYIGLSVGVLYGTCYTTSQWSGDTGGPVNQLVETSNGWSYRRSGTAAGGWGAWKAEYSGHKESPRNLHMTDEGRQANRLTLRPFTSSPAGYLNHSLSAGPGSITIPNYTVDFGDGQDSITGTTISGLGYSTFYYVWGNHPKLDWQDVTFSANTSFFGHTSANRIMLGNTTTQSSSGTGGGGGSWCVDASAWLAPGVRAGEAKPGDAITLLRHDKTGPEQGAIESIELADEECVELVSQRGVRLTVSVSTPIELPDGSFVTALEMSGRPIAVLIGGRFRWDSIHRIEPAGIRRVAKIHVGGRVYAAGTTSRELMFTHNPEKP